MAAACAVLAFPSPWRVSGAGPGGAARPRLVLVLSVDQMRFDYLTRFAPLYEGGFRRLGGRAAVFSNARYRHANTETGPGHSVMLSGRSPRHSGIVGNDWYDTLLGRHVNVVDDPVEAALGGPGRSASPRNFIGFTVGDVLKKVSPLSRVVGLALKDRSAILMAGPRGDAAYWYERAGGHFITSTYYMAAAPAWLQAWNSGRPADRYAGQSWTRLLADESVYLKYAGEDDVKGEWDNKDTVFPHTIRGRPPAEEFYDDLRRTPFADELTLEAALAAMTAHKLGADEATDILALGFAATDVIGHTYGADSQELMDQMLRLDLTFEKLFEEVDRRVGLQRTLVVLTADHGALPLVEVLKSRGVDARRVHPDVLKTAVERALSERFPGVSGLVAAYDGPHVYLDLELARRSGLTRGGVEAAAKEGLLASGVVEAVYSQVELLGDPPPGDAEFPLFQRAFFQPRSPHLVARLKPYVYLASYTGGSGHGTAHDYDRHVPIAFMGAGIKPGTYPEPCGPEDIAPTLGALLGLDYPLQDAGRMLTEVLAR